MKYRLEVHSFNIVSWLYMHIFAICLLFRELLNSTAFSNHFFVLMYVQHETVFNDNTFDSGGGGGDYSSGFDDGGMGGGME